MCANSVTSNGSVHTIRLPLMSLQDIAVNWWPSVSSLVSNKCMQKIGYLQKLFVKAAFPSHVHVKDFIVN